MDFRATALEPRTTNMTTRVLLVDDSEDMRLLCRLLIDAEPGIEVCAEAANGVEAIQRTASDQPDVIVLDIEMPVMGGFEALREIRATYPHIKVIMLSAAPSDERRAESLRLGAEALVCKDATMQALRNELIRLATKVTAAV